MGLISDLFQEYGVEQDQPTDALLGIPEPTVDASAHWVPEWLPFVNSGEGTHASVAGNLGKTPEQRGQFYQNARNQEILNRTYEAYDAESPVDEVMAIGEEQLVREQQQREAGDLAQFAQGFGEATTLGVAPTLGREAVSAVSKSGASFASMIARGLGADYLADKYARESNLIEGATEEVRQEEAAFPWLSKIYGGTLTSLLQIAPGAASGAGVAPIIGMAAGGEYTSAAQEARDVGLSEQAAKKYAVEQAAIEGGITAGFQMLGLGGLESALTKKAASNTYKELAKNFLKQTGQELPEELTIEFFHNISRAAAKVDPNADNYENQLQTAIDTTAQTVMTMGLVNAQSALGVGLSNKADRAEAANRIKALLPYVTDEAARSTLQKFVDSPSRQNLDKAKPVYDEWVKTPEAQAAAESLVSDQVDSVLGPAEAPETQQDAPPQPQPTPEPQQQPEAVTEPPVSPESVTEPPTEQGQFEGVPADPAKAVDARVLQEEQNPPQTVEAESPAAEGVPPLYHGTSQEIDQPFLDVRDFPASGGENLMGVGFYATDRRETADAYTKKGKGKTPAVYSVRWKKTGTPAILDADTQPVPDTGLSYLENVLRARGVDDAGVAEFLSENSGKPFADTIKEFKKVLGDVVEAAPSYEFDEEFAELSSILNRQAGIDAITYRGGLRTKSPEHQAYVWLNPQDIEISKTTEPSQPVVQEEVAEPSEQPAKEKETWELTAEEALERGLTYGTWSNAVSRAFVDEKIDEDSPQYQSLLNSTVNDFSGVSLIGKQIHVPTQSGHKFGTVIGAIKNGGVRVLHTDGTESLQSADNLDDLGAWIQHREKRGRPVPDEARELLSGEQPAAPDIPTINLKESAPEERATWLNAVYDNSAYFQPEEIDSAAEVLKELRQGELYQLAKESGAIDFATKSGKSVSRGSSKDTLVDAILEPVRQGASPVQAEQQTEQPQVGQNPSLKSILDRVAQVVGKGSRVRLSDLRKAFPDVSRETLDDALLRIERAGYFAMHPLNDPSEIREDDKSSVLRTPVGSERHILYYDGDGDASILAEQERQFNPETEQQPDAAPAPAEEQVAEKPSRKRKMVREPKAEDSQQAMHAGIPLMKPPKQRDDFVPEVAQSEIPEVEQRIRKAHGLKKPSLKEWAGGIWNDIKRKVTRSHEHLPNTGFEQEKEFFRLLKTVGDAASDETSRRLVSITNELGPKQMHIFERKLLLQNQLASAKMGQPLRFGYTSIEQIERDLAKLDKALQHEQMQPVRDALEKREQERQELVGQLVEANLINPEALENDAYFHQMVLSKLLFDRIVSGRSPRKMKRAFQKGRVESEEAWDEALDYNTSYLEAESLWMTEARIELRKNELLSKLPNKMPDFVAQAKQRSEETGEKVTWRDILKENPEYAAWQPVPGNVFYKAFTVQDKIAEAILSGQLDKATISEEDIREGLMIGQQRPHMILRREMVDQLNSTSKPKRPGPATEFFEEAMKGWKVWTLLNPKRALQYTLRNLTGDLDPAFAAAPGIVTRGPEAVDAMAQFFYRTDENIPENVKKARDLGVMGAALTASEIPDIKDIHVFKRFYQSKADPKKIPKSYFDTVKRFNEFREGILRYAAFLYYQEQLQNGTLTHYGGARKETVDALARDMGVDVAAAHLSRNLLGDYGNLTVFGDYLRRKFIPFWSFQEVNLKRYPNLIMNAMRAGDLKTAGSTASLAALRLALTSRIAWGYGAIWAWNNLVGPALGLFDDDDDEDLGKYDRQNPHIMLGKNADGSIEIFRNVGALGDFLEWFGINSAPELLEKWQNGQIDEAEVLKEMLKDPINKIWGGLRPEIKAVEEVGLGQSRFPDVFQPRAVDKGEAAASIFGLRDEFKWVRGMVLGDGERARPHYWQRWFSGVVDPRRNAISEMYDLRDDYLKKKGVETVHPAKISQFKPLLEAGYSEDYDAFKQARRAYIEEGGDYDGFKRFLGRLDPISSRLSDEDEKEFAEEFLTGIQREKMKVAQDYADSLKVTMWQWWQTASQEDSPEQRVQFDNAFRSDIGNQLYDTITKDPEAESFDKAKLNKTADELRQLGLGHDELKESLTYAYHVRNRTYDLKTLTRLAEQRNLSTGGDKKEVFNRLWEDGWRPTRSTEHFRTRMDRLKELFPEASNE